MVKNQNMDFGATGEYYCQNSANFPLYRFSCFEYVFRKFVSKKSNNKFIKV